MTRWIQNPSRRKCTCQKDVAAVARAEESQPRFLGFRESCYSLRQRTVLCRFVCPICPSFRSKTTSRNIRDQIVFRFGPRPDFLAKKTVVLNNPAIIRDDIRHSFSCLYFAPPEPRVQRARLLILLSRTLEQSQRSIIAFYSHRKRCETYVSLC